MTLPVACLSKAESGSPPWIPTICLFHEHHCHADCAVDGCLYNVYLRTLTHCFTFSLLYTALLIFGSMCPQSLHLLHWPSLCSLSKLWGELISKWWRFAGGGEGGLQDINKQRYFRVIFREYDREEMHKIFGKKNWDLINSRWHRFVIDPSPILSTNPQQWLKIVFSWIHHYHLIIPCLITFTSNKIYVTWIQKLYICSYCFKMLCDTYFVTAYCTYTNNPLKVTFHKSLMMFFIMNLIMLVIMKRYMFKSLALMHKG